MPKLNYLSEPTITPITITKYRVDRPGRNSREFSSREEAEAFASFERFARWAERSYSSHVTLNDFLENDELWKKWRFTYLLDDSEVEVKP